MIDLMTLTITEAAQQLAQGTLSSVELTQAYLDRIAAIDGLLNSYLLVLSERALAQAAAADHARSNGQSLGLLHGLPLAAKDLFEIAGYRTTAGSKFLRDHISPVTSTAVKRLEAAGAIMLGKLNMHEWALGIVGDNPHYGPCNNPWDVNRICGGSSSGSSAAVAAGLCMAALGSDTRGSIRVPAALCGVVGFKPTFGRIGLYGAFALSWHLDHAGTLTRSVQDAATLLTVLAGYDDHDAYSANTSVPDYLSELKAGIHGWRIAVDTSTLSNDAAIVSMDMRNAYQQAIDQFASLGATIQPMSMEWLEPAILMSRQIVSADAAALHAQRLLDDPAGFGEDVLSRLQQGPPPTAAAYAQLRHEQMLLTRRVDQLFRDYDIVLLPGVPFAAARRDDTHSFELGRTHYPRFTPAFNLAGVPVATIPCGFSSERMPLGVQVVSGRGRDGDVLRAAHAYEQATTWHLQRPSI
jgi:aspartyl-tRNA(Asn)/glutamyl-tRNA(Gln) amidotransferase subunit A